MRLYTRCISAVIVATFLIGPGIFIVVIMITVVIFIFFIAVIVTFGFGFIMAIGKPIVFCWDIRGIFIMVVIIMVVIIKFEGGL